MFAILYAYYYATHVVASRLNNLKRWTDRRAEAKYNELAKQALNCFVAFCLTQYSENCGKKVNFTNFPKIAIGRAFAKAYVYYDTSEHRINEICELGGIGKEAFDETARKIISEKTDENFARFVSEEYMELEVNIYRAATKIATLVELLELHPESTKVKEVEDSIKIFYDIPGVEALSDRRSPVFELFKQISNLRNQTRWATAYCNVKCSVLGHLFDTAMFAYLMALEENHDEEYATRMFFMGIFHDIPETWTKDIPSPIKDRIPGYRVATEAYEIQMLNKHFYSVLPYYMVKAFKPYMLEEEENGIVKWELKRGDYLSANSECGRLIEAGSWDTTFSNAILGDIPGLPPNAKRLHDEFCNIALRHKMMAANYQLPEN